MEETENIHQERLTEGWLFRLPHTQIDGTTCKTKKWSKIWL